MRNSTGIIKIKEIDNENYVGIGIDGNNRFLINDFTVTHNCLNVRDATSSQLLNNEEINNIKQILGLKQNVDYKDTKSLRYGKVMILTDADVDGSHIRAFFINMIHATYPGLIKLNFIQTMKTPIVKAMKGKQVIEFFTEQDYNIWKRNTQNTKGFNVKYFKGLGTSKKEDAQDLFKRLDTLRVDYYYKDAKCDEAILLAFEKDKNVKEQEVSCTDMRKKWLSNYDKNSYIDLKETKTSYQDVIHKDLIHFSIYDNLRSIPSLCDGLKPSQRKILYYMLKNNIQKDIKVAQLSGYISAEMAYHHGEVSLQGAIVNMAQDFVGSNNINLLVPEGNFGSRLNSKDAASPRYIFTRLSPDRKSVV
jgi:DNA topoisomerase-2